MNYLYLIGKDIKTGYIGVTNNPKLRFKFHKKSKYKVGQYIRKNQLEYSDMKILMIGDKKFSFEIESKLRPFPLMGLNEAVGGFGGYSSYTSNRNEKISKAVKGRKLSQEWKTNISKSKIGLQLGNKNPKAKKFLLTNPSGIKYEVHGNMVEFCKSHNIMGNLIRKHINHNVPPYVSGTFGGFRAKDKMHLEKRNNTTGWKLEWCS